MFDLELKRQLEELVLKNDIDKMMNLYLGSLSEVKAEFEGFSDYEELSEIIKKIRLDIIVTSANWKDLKSKISKGVINSETASLERNRILYRLVELIDEIPKSKKLYNFLKIKEGIDLDFTVSLNSRFSNA